MKNSFDWNKFFRKNFALDLNLPSGAKETVKEELMLVIPPIRFQMEFFRKKAITLRNCSKTKRRKYFMEGWKYFRFKGWKILLSPYTVGAGFPGNIQTTDRPRGGYCFVISDSADEVSRDTLFRSPADLSAEFKKTKEVGLTFFEYLAFHALRPAADRIYTNMLLSSQLSDGKVVCVDKNHACKEMRVFAYPQTYNENNSQGGRRGKAILLHKLK